MEDNIALKVSHLSKKYAIGTQKDNSFRESVSSLFKSRSLKTQDFWALKDVNFEIKKGDVIGIIGKNGAGKSTLLKILSQITKPTEGKIFINGRIASLLEVGTGFHPELTGRENIYLNGTILGMTRKEVKSKFDEIVTFSGIDKFIDTPVKHYSSGMYVRLAFAVAAHLESEILIIDEVLAVGDIEFQKKCLGKMKDVAKDGRTVIFVSHDLVAVNSLCTNAILIKNGSIIKTGNTNDVINYYLSNENVLSNSVSWSIENAPGDEFAQLLSARLIDEEHNDIITADISHKIGIEYTYKGKLSGTKKIPNVHLYTAKGDCVFVSAESESDKLMEEGIFKTIAWIPGNLLNVETYSVGIALSTMSPLKVHFWVKEALLFEVYEDVKKRSNNYNQSIPGIIRPLIEWETTIEN